MVITVSLQERFNNFNLDMQHFTIIRILVIAPAIPCVRGGEGGRRGLSINTINQERAPPHAHPYEGRKMCKNC